MYLLFDKMNHITFALMFFLSKKHSWNALKVKTSVVKAVNLGVKSLPKFEIC